MAQENDRELLESAAKAIGMDGYEYRSSNAFYGDHFETQWAMQKHGRASWNSLVCSKDALRLAAELEFNVYYAASSVFVEDLDDGIEIQQEYGGNRLSATLRAITRAAAEIGKQLKEKNHA